MTVEDSYDVLIAEESDKLIDTDQIVGEAISAVENNGIVFLDEIDKICSRTDGARIGGSGHGKPDEGGGEEGTARQDRATARHGFFGTKPTCA